MPTEISPLNAGEIQALGIHEQTIQRGLQSFIDVGRSLAEIRDARLFRGAHKTFEDYCRCRWGLSRRRAYQAIDHAENCEAVCTVVHNLTERQTRPLAKLATPEQKREAMQNAVEHSGGKPTAQDVAAAVEAIKAKAAMRSHGKVPGYDQSEAMKLATMAILSLSKIHKSDKQRAKALAMVEEWLATQKRELFANATKWPIET